jgi:phospholipid/cholesterol/gamma-HCH transport system ATP-binding protein
VRVKRMKAKAENPQNPIDVTDLHKSFGSQTVLDGIGLEVGEGETVAVMGRSGTGKSVLLKVLIGLEPADSGAVRIRGSEIGKLGEDELNEIRKKIGFLFQQAALYDSMTIEQNVMFPITRHSRTGPEEQKKRARELLTSVGMDKDFDKLPSQISGGMQKRVGLARALALDPEILLFDEPTAGLDPITSAEISNLIVDLKKERRMTAVVVTHDIHSAQVFADRAVLMDNGKIVAEGSFAKLLKSKDAFVTKFLREGC